MSLDADKKLITRIDEHGKNLTPFEVEFVESCLARLEGGVSLTEKQRALAHRIDDERVS